MRSPGTRTWHRPPPPVGASGSALSVPGLSFAHAPGPSFAVVGLAGGAGASVLAYLTAVTAAKQSTAPVIVADIGGSTGGLAAHAGVAAPRTLAEIAESIDAGEPPSGTLWAQGEGGLRVLAGAPQFTVEASRDAVQRVLTDARAAHGLTVLDVGTLGRPAEQAALATATHVAWVLPATGDGIMRARRVLEHIATLRRPEIIVARPETGVRKPPVGDLADLADERRSPLVLMPSVGDVCGASSDEIAERAQVALQAIGGVLHR
jgi:hypothetical protein